MDEPQDRFLTHTPRWSPGPRGALVKTQTLTHRDPQTHLDTERDGGTAVAVRPSRRLPRGLGQGPALSPLSQQNTPDTAALDLHTKVCGTFQTHRVHFTVNVDSLSVTSFHSCRSRSPKHIIYKQAFYTGMKTEHRAQFDETPP